jgi:hypothetical protein
VTECSESLPAVTEVCGSTLGLNLYCTFCLFILLMGGAAGSFHPRRAARMLQLLVSHILRSSVCVCRAANDGDDDFASFVQLLLDCAVFQFCQNRLRGCDSVAGTDCNRSKASENPRIAVAPLLRACVAPPMAATTISPCSFNCSRPVFFPILPNRHRGCDSGAGAGCNRSKASANPRTAFTPLPRPCVAPPMAATTNSPCSLSCSWPALISNYAKTGSGVVILGPALAAIDSGRP